MMTMPWIALVPDISGVCSIVGTFEMTSKPTNTVEDEHGQLDDQRLVHVVSWPVERRAGRGVDDLAAARDGSVADHLVVVVEHQRAVLDDAAEQLGDVPGVQLARVLRHGGGRVA